MTNIHDEAHDDGHHGHHGEGFQFYAKPRQRQRWGDAQVLPHTDFGDTFFDLFYVAAAYNLGNLIRLSPTNLGVLYFAGCFYPIMIIWNQKMFYFARFSTNNDLLHRLFEYLLLVILGTAVLYIRPVAIMSTPVSNEDMFAFSLCICLASFHCLARVLEVKFNVDGQEAAKRQASFEIYWYSSMNAFYIAAAVVSGLDYFDGGEGTAAHRLLGAAATGDVNHIPIGLLLAGSLCHPIGLLINIFSIGFKEAHNLRSVPLNVGFYIHRNGEWTMLMLGESVLSLLIVPTQTGTDYYKAFFCGILSITLLEILHFRSQPQDADGHALRRSRTGGFTFTQFQQLYSAALIVLGTSYKMILYEYVYEATATERRLAGGSDPPIANDIDRRQRIAHFFCISLALVWLCLDVMMLAHKGVQFNLDRCKSCEVHQNRTKYAFIMGIFRVGLIVFIASASQYLTDPSLLALVGLMGIIIQVLLRVAGSFFFNESDGSIKIQKSIRNMNGIKDIDLGSDAED